MKKTGRINRIACLSMSAVICVLSLAACGSAGTTDYTNGNSGEAEQSAAAGTEDTAALQSSESGDGNTASSAESEEGAPESALPSTMDEGEVILGQDGSSTYFEGTLPQEDISWTEDMAAWINIPGTGIDAAVMKSSSDGVIFLDPDNDGGFSDPNTILHGTAEPEDAPLHGILAYGDESFFRKNSYIYIFLPDGAVFEYRIFAAYSHAEEDILKTYDCYDPETFTSYMNSIFGLRDMSSVTDSSLQSDVLSTWCILTLQAETADGENFIVQATATGAGNSESGNGGSGSGGS